jgi:hypothetical protein
MRLPNIENDYWALHSGEAAHKEHPESFWIPPLEDRQNLKIGQVVKLIFEIETVNEREEVSVSVERMWVMVAGKQGDYYMGRLMNEPASQEPSDELYLCNGAEIPFLAEHVIEIDNPPEEYSSRQLAKAPNRTWPPD